MNKRKQKNKKTIIIILLLIISISVGYSYLTASSQLKGDTTFLPNKWQIYLTSVDIINDTTESPLPVLSDDNMTLTFSPTLKLPGDEYSFSVHLKNNGTIDAMISNIERTDLDESLDKYATYEITYIDGSEVKVNDKIPAGEALPLKVTLTYKEDLIAEDLPSELTMPNVSMSVDCVPANETAQDVVLDYSMSIEDQTWTQIINNVNDGLGKYYKLGSTKEVDMGTLGVHTIRVANTSTPEECSQEGFSQTACGFVLEFADAISSYKMNTGYTNKNGWKSTIMRTYVNTDIYNALPTELREAIVDTYVVSGYGRNETNNIITTDKLYLLSTREVWGTEGSVKITDDSAIEETRQLDYYKEQGVTTDNYEAAQKVRNWWLRSAVSTYQTFYIVSQDGGYFSMEAPITNVFASPAFRIGG